MFHTYYFLPLWFYQIKIEDQQQQQQPEEGALSSLYSMYSLSSSSSSSMDCCSPDKAAGPPLPAASVGPETLHNVTERRRTESSCERESVKAVRRHPKHITIGQLCGHQQYRTVSPVYDPEWFIIPDVDLTCQVIRVRIRPSTKTVTNYRCTGTYRIGPKKRKTEKVFLEIVIKAAQNFTSFDNQKIA